MKKTNRAFSFLFSMVLVPLTALILNGTATNSRAQTGETGLIFEGQSTPNQVPVTVTEYTGECPGTEESGDIKAWFVSNILPPQPRQRVRITNVTTGMNPNRLPYTDRAYDKGNSSEPILMQFGTEHGDSRFRVQRGLNEFEYQIRQGRETVEEGRFTALFDVQTRSQVRNSQLVTQEVCANTNITLNRCGDRRTQNQWKCPDGQVIRQETFPQGPVKTMIRNETSEMINFEIRGRQYSLWPGQSIELTDSNPGFVRYSNRSTSLQPGVLYRFQIFGNTLNLVDR